jgi:hypothetical protein
MPFRRVATPAKSRPPARVLLAYEFGAGRTHVSHLLSVAGRLREAGVECLATLYDLRSAPEWEAQGIPVVQNYLWPGWKRWAPHDDDRPDRGFVDILGNLGFGRADAVAGAMAHYDGLFTLFRPDLVITENAFGALLAARGRVPAIACGFNQLLPPPLGEGFPTFDDRPPSWPDEDVLPGLNAGLVAGARPPLACMRELLAVDAVLPFGPDAFDLYRAMRPAPVLPVHVKGFVPGTRAGGREEIFVYLQNTATQMPAVLAALLTLRRPMRAYLPDAGVAERDLLAGAGAVIEDRPVPIGLILERSRCVLHHGGVGLACALLAAGMPQVILSKELDNQAPGRFVAENGFGDHRWLWDATTPWIVEATRRTFDDDAVGARCRARAPDFDAWFGSDPSEPVFDAACRLLRIDGRR